MAERDPYADLPDNDTAVADDDPYAGLPDAPKSRLASAVDTAVDVGERAIRRGIRGLSQSGPLAPIANAVGGERAINRVLGFDEIDQRRDQEKGRASGIYVQD